MNWERRSWDNIKVL